jgi:hypothetical protein
MGFTVYYRSTRPVEATQAAAIRSAAGRLCEGRTWLHCEPIHLFPDLGDGRLFGGSKPNFLPDPRDEASATASGLPDGTLRDVLDILERLSRDHVLDWEISHDESGGPVGYIRGGVCDDEARSLIQTLDDLAMTLAEDLGDGGDGDPTA